MKTTQFFFLGLLNFLTLLVNSQNTQTAAATSYGLNAGTSTVSTAANTFYGYLAGNQGSGTKNTLIGANAGRYAYNSSTVCIGNNAGASTVGFFAGSIYIGDGAGFTTGTLAGSTVGSGSISIGQNSGNDRMGGNNTFLGNNSGKYTNGSGNIFIGPSSGGTNVAESNKLFIETSNTSTPLIWGDFANDLLKFNGKVGIGSVVNFPTNTLYTNYKLFVTGGILTDEVRVVSRDVSGNWPDYVFAKDYKLPTLEEVEKQIKVKGHLQNVPSAKEIKENGIALGEMAKIQQEKIEELTLYLIQQNKEIEELKAQVKILLNNSK